MTDRRIIGQFTALTFCIAFSVSGALIVLGRFGYSVHGWVRSLPQFMMNVPFAIYILSPAIASYIVLKRSGTVASPKEWLATVFHARNSILLYGYVIAVLALYFLIHLAVSGPIATALPLYTFLLSLPGNLIIGGLEESGWAYVLQPRLNAALGYTASSLVTSGIWILWHVPLFFIPGTNQAAGLIDFGMFAVQLIAFRFLYGAISLVSGKGAVFMCVLCHTMFNAASSAIGIPPATWAGTLAANAAVGLVAVARVAIRRSRRNR
nr:CPBP family glutamic-type intramembrane protease [Propionicimonas sp.]